MIEHFSEKIKENTALLLFLCRKTHTFLVIIFEMSCNGCFVFCILLVLYGFTNVSRSVLSGVTFVLEKNVHF